MLANPDALRRILGYLPQEFGLYPTLSAEVTLDHFAAMKGVLDGRQRRGLVADLLLSFINKICGMYSKNESIHDKIYQFFL